MKNLVLFLFVIGVIAKMLVLDICAFTANSFCSGVKQEKGQLASSTQVSSDRLKAIESNSNSGRGFLNEKLALYPIKRSRLNRCFRTVFSDLEIKNFVVLAIKLSYEQFGISREPIDRIIDTLSYNYKEDLGVISGKLRSCIKHTDFEEKFKAYNTGSGRFLRKLGPTKRFIKGPVVADIGCGNGGFSIEIAKMIPDLRKIIATDIEEYHHITNPLIEFRKQSSADQLPIESEYVDTVMLMDVLHHVKEEFQRGLLTDVKRILKPSGKVIIWEDSYSNSLRSIHKDELSNDLLEKFLKLQEQQKKEVLSFNDVLVNAVFRDLAMPFPFSYKTIEEWEKTFNDLGFFVRHKQFLGIPKGSFYFATKSFFILEKTKNHQTLKTAYLKSNTML